MISLKKQQHALLPRHHSSPNSTE